MAESKTLLKLEPGTKEFTANGHKYKVSGSLSPFRWEIKIRKEIEVAFGASVKTISDQLMLAWKALDADKKGDAYINIHNVLNGLKQINDGKRHVFWDLCALYINREDEDPKTITQDQIDEKIDDWFKEGVDQDSFFVMALGSIPEFRAAYEQVSRVTSPKQQTTQKSQNPN